LDRRDPEHHRDQRTGNQRREPAQEQHKRKRARADGARCAVIVVDPFSRQGLKEDP
jgi:hypothetical protein